MGMWMGSKCIVRLSACVCVLVCVCVCMLLCATWQAVTVGQTKHQCCCCSESTLHVPYTHARTCVDTALLSVSPSASTPVWRCTVPTAVSTAAVLRPWDLALLLLLRALCRTFRDISHVFSCHR